MNRSERSLLTRENIPCSLQIPSGKPKNTRGHECRSECWLMDDSMNEEGQQQPARRITGWHIGTIALLAVGYSAYYFCRSDYSVALPLILAEQVKHGADAISREAMSILLDCGMGWRGLFVTGAGLLALLMLLNLIFLRESPTEYSLEDTMENPESLFAQPEAIHSQPGTGAVFRALFSSYTFWLVCFLSLGTTLLRETFNLWTPTYFTQFAGMTSAQAASGSALFPLFGGFSVLLAGVLSDFFGASGHSRILFGGLAFSVAVLIALAFAPAHLPQWILLALVGLVAFMIIGPYSYLAGAMSLDFGGKEGGATASGVVDSAGYLAGALSGNGMAYVVVTLGWKAFFLVLAAVAALSAVVAAVVLLQQNKMHHAQKEKPEPVTQAGH
jgi:OPA family glycerol-3-phosphate transporter-like MFS transporter